jgi:hypothetical protein
VIGRATVTSPVLDAVSTIVRNPPGMGATIFQSPASLRLVLDEDRIAVEHLPYIGRFDMPLHEMRKVAHVEFEVSYEMRIEHKLALSEPNLKPDASELIASV